MNYLLYISYFFHRVGTAGATRYLNHICIHAIVTTTRSSFNSWTKIPSRESSQNAPAKVLTAPVSTSVAVTMNLYAFASGWLLTEFRSAEMPLLRLAV